MADPFNTPIEYIKGVGPARASLLRSELGMETGGDLLFHFPFRYVDRTRYHKIRDVNSDAAQVQIVGKLISLREAGAPRSKRLTAILEDETGTLELVWFRGVRWLRQKLKVNEEVVVFGKPNFFKGKLSIPHPEVEPLKEAQAKAGGALQPVYPSTEKLGAKGLSTAGLSRLIKPLLPEIEGRVPDWLPREWRLKFRFPTSAEALHELHAPSGIDSLELARKRIKFDELLLSQLVLVGNKNAQTREMKGVIFEEVGTHFLEFYEKHLPFELTGAQKRVLKEIRKDMKFGAHMNRLVQGDVGSGKTVVALLTGLLALDNGYQVCLMAPTEILANQHYATFTEMLGEMDVSIALLTGSSNKAKRAVIHETLESGELDILIGTHALIEPKVKFKRLGLAIIDEQHRFGVKQRAKLWKKAEVAPHVLVMTATPIPRTLSMTLYGDLDVSVIDELPPGRKEVQTVHRTDADRLRVFGFMKEEIKKGGQVYVVYPLIEESETMDYKDLMDGYEAISRAFPMPEYRLGILHGRMKPEAKDYEMMMFANGTNHILVSTTVIEVGVNVPNASVMIIESSEKFGLSQLHQLRGRVGRGADQSYCILMTGNKLSNDARVRLETMCRTNDGFEIAEVDLQLRGPGDILGTQQSGVMQFRLADLAKDQEILIAARHTAEEILTADPKLNQPENQALREALVHAMKDKLQWGKIS